MKAVSQVLGSGERGQLPVLRLLMVQRERPLARCTELPGAALQASATSWVSDILTWRHITLEQVLGGQELGCLVHLWTLFAQSVPGTP